ncbi:hypothetical protein D9M68_230020 [compost metagenome]
MHENAAAISAQLAGGGAAGARRHAGPARSGADGTGGEPAPTGSVADPILDRAGAGPRGSDARAGKRRTQRAAQLRELASAVRSLFWRGGALLNPPSRASLRADASSPHRSGIRNYGLQSIRAYLGQGPRTTGAPQLLPPVMHSLQHQMSAVLVGLLSKERNFAKHRHRQKRQCPHQIQISRSRGA